MKLQQLHSWKDTTPRKAALQMAVDEALFAETMESGIPILRVYQWQAPAVTFGYFGDYPLGDSRPAIRRITGGGLVEHGEDVTFCLTIPAASAAAGLSVEQRYRWIHEAFFEVISGYDFPLRWIEDAGSQNGPCFSNPVKWDLVDSDGNKIIGGAQRRSRGAVIHQGSVQLPGRFQIGGSDREWLDQWVSHLAEMPSKISVKQMERIEVNAEILRAKKYGKAEWNTRRKTD